MFVPWCTKARAAAFAEGKRLGRLEADAENTARDNDVRRIECAQLIGAPVIVVPNEWTNPIIGFGHSIMMVGRSPVLVIDDGVTGTMMTCGGVKMDYSDQRLEIVLGLNPYELWAITAHNAVGHNDYDKPKTGTRSSAEDIRAALDRNGFFVRWREFQGRLRS